MTVRNRFSPYLDPVTGKSFPVYIREDQKPAFAFSQGKGKQISIICSIPKSGTYLYGELLKNKGLIDCGVHLREDGFTDYRFSSLEQSRKQHHSLRSAFPLHEAIALAFPGQFLVGHLPCTDYTLSSLKNCRILFTFRNIRDAMVSQMRFFAQNNRGNSLSNGWGLLPESPEKLKQYIKFHGDFFIKTRCATMLDWLGHHNVLPCSFETIYGDNGKAAQLDLLQSIEKHLELDTTHEAQELFSKIIKTETITSTGQRTDFSTYWDEEVESYFKASGGIEINKKLGYKES
jgi:hypothetical protein